MHAATRNHRFVLDASKRIELAVLAVSLAGILSMAWLWHQNAPLWVYYGYIGASAAAGAVLYVSQRALDQPVRRRLLQLLLAASLFAAAAFRDSRVALFQIEGLFFDLLDGVLFAAVIHYLIAKIAGPFVFGRVWCGWACWTGAVLDQLPYKRSPGRLPGRWGWVRYAHFLASFGLVAALWYGLGYRPGQNHLPALAWFLAGNALYLALGVGLALVLKDNRAFCKYACPITVLLKLGTPFALVNVRGDRARCCRRRVCESICPMDVRIAEYLEHDQRISSSECILCQACIHVCPEQALTLSLGVDANLTERLRRRDPAG